LKLPDIGATRGQRGEQILNRGAGWVYLHVVIDEHSRYLYVEQHDREDAETDARCLERAIEHFAELDLRALQAVMTELARLHPLAALQAILDRIGTRAANTRPEIILCTYTREGAARKRPLPYSRN